MANQASTMNYEEAMKEVIKLKGQGFTYPKIEQHLKKVGYISARTGRPIGALAVRYMINSNEQKLKPKNPEEVEPKLEAKPTLSFVDQAFDAIKKIIDLQEIPGSTKMVMIKSLLVEAESNKNKKR